MQELGTLLKKHYARTITGAERQELHELLLQKYSYGDRIDEYLCLTCGRPIILTWNFGFRCLWMYGGCGVPFQNAA